MSRDQQADGAHGYGICVKGGKETGTKKINFLKTKTHKQTTS